MTELIIANSNEEFWCISDNNDKIITPNEKRFLFSAELQEHLYRKTLNTNFQFFVRWEQDGSDHLSKGQIKTLISEICFFIENIKLFELGDFIQNWPNFENKEFIQFEDPSYVNEFIKSGGGNLNKYSIFILKKLILFLQKALCEDKEIYIMGD